MRTGGNFLTQLYANRKNRFKNLSIYVNFVFVLPKYLYAHFDDGVLA